VRVAVSHRRQPLTALWLALATALIGRGLAATLTRPSPAVLREHLREILSSGAYQVNPPLSWQIQRWLIGLLMRLLRWLSNLSTSGPLAGLPEYLSWVITGILVLALVLILYHIAYTLRALLSGPPRRVEEGERVSPRRRSPQQALRAAKDAAARGDFELAVRLLYEAALRRLDRRGLLSYASSRTNWENLRALKSAGLRSIMAPLTRAVDDIFYGGRRATAQSYGDCQEWVAALWDAEA